MARAADKRIEQAKAMYLSGRKLVDIADELDLPEGTVRRWKCTHKWDNERSDKKANVRKRGAQPGNKNSAGGPPGNNKAEKHGLFRKYLPEETFSIIENMPTNPLEIIWHEIQIQYAAIVRSQQIMYVKDREDKTVERIEKRDGNIIGEAWEVQQAWDKQASFLKAQSTAITALKNMIKDYLELEGASKADANEQVKDWKQAIIAIAKRRKEKAAGAEGGAGADGGTGGSP